MEMVQKVLVVMEMTCTTCPSAAMLLHICSTAQTGAHQGHANHLQAVVLIALNSARISKRSRATLKQIMLKWLKLSETTTTISALLKLKSSWKASRYAYVAFLVVLTRKTATTAKARIQYSSKVIFTKNKRLVHL